jgi:sporulation-control protein spo0M
MRRAEAANAKNQADWRVSVGNDTEITLSLTIPLALPITFGQ